MDKRRGGGLNTNDLGLQRKGGRVGAMQTPNIYDNFFMDISQL